MHTNPFWSLPPHYAQNTENTYIKNIFITSFGVSLFSKLLYCWLLHLPFCVSSGLLLQSAIIRQHLNWSWTHIKQRKKNHKFQCIFHENKILLRKSFTLCVHRCSDVKTLLFRIHFRLQMINVHKRLSIRAFFSFAHSLLSLVYLWRVPVYLLPIYKVQTSRKVHLIIHRLPANTETCIDSHKPQYI